MTAPVGLNPTTPAPPRNTVTAFGGSPLHEAKSLLRPCLPRGHYGKPLNSLPEPLESLVGRKVTLAGPQIAAYLQKAKVSDRDLGGPLASTLPKVRYFVIHDTSSMLGAGVSSFPSDINTLGWAKNSRQSLQAYRDAHVFISRVGTSFTAHDFSIAYSATKFTMHQSPSLKEKFCHVELIQPRLNHNGSDWQAPSPGFPDIQLERLALVYVIASARHDEWLIPAYHHNVDMGLPAHDDPQNFDLSEWAQALEGLINDILGVPRVGDFPAGRGDSAG